MFFLKILEKRKEVIKMKFDEKMIRMVSICVAVALSVPLVMSIIALFVGA